MFTFRQYLRTHRYFLLASFLLPVIILAGIYLSIGIYPGSSRSILASDAFAQFSNFHASFRNMLLGKQSFFYTWNASLGLNYLSLVSYYLGGLFTPLVLFFPNSYMPDALYVVTLVKIGAAGLSFWLFAQHTFKLSRWNLLTLSSCYALMSFAIAHSEIVMWLDTFTFLPLVIWGIHRLIQQRRPWLLFISYTLLFISNFYMGFMVALFSGLYYLVLLFTQWKDVKHSFFPYALTAGLSVGTAMLTLLPTYLDLKTNGEELTKITTLKTEATGMFDFFIKNMVGVYDTTKYGSIPFIYIGLLPLSLCLFYFFVRTIPWQKKVGFALLAGLIIASFYFQPLNLFWQGMHAPNMFLFRYSFLLSFLIILLAGYGWEQLTPKHTPIYLLGNLLLLICFIVTYFVLDKSDTAYGYVTLSSFILTLVFLGLYALCTASMTFHVLSLKQFSLLLLLCAVVEIGLNTNGMIHGILDDWNYASRSLYTDPYPSIQSLVNQTKEDNTTFYRLENLDNVSPNDSINYGYSGISLFSSIRNRHSSSYLNQLGFRSSGTNLNIRYNNNTLLMDAFTGIKYNIASTPISKYGFTQTTTKGNYSLFENTDALSLGYLASTDDQAVTTYDNDNLLNQTTLMNYLSGLDLNYFTLYPIRVINTNNTTIETQGNQTTYKEVASNLAKDVTWDVTIPANTQAYLSLYPSNYNDLQSSTVTIRVNGTERKTQLNINGQYYDLGYYANETTVTFAASFYGTDQVTFQTPKVVGLDTIAYQEAVDAIQSQNVSMTTTNRGASATITTGKEQALITTIPYDKGWSVAIDGKKATVSSFKDAFVKVTIPKGTHTVVFSYLPDGFLLGLYSSLISIALFVFLQWLYGRHRKNHHPHT
ncbi:YfhO family protein [Enterococcus italicus]|uniref:Bacterial membrane protein YfhO n=1 Tax=Enterococcus italicus (strain DSM 15952 / CCUG 50447 / LMG 22039 / TP 1.5) TaxID=888064 RepID=E6LDY6_ENTI1|nr:YfhO family protein [Enterococcus italicus]EFU74580.1 bacterial membrane protein YfhO [Enterococcus italicus DSM 15952]OJG58570.1 copper ABC transporter permease [Enterococcus italicus DSM 15952]